MSLLITLLILAALLWAQASHYQFLTEKVKTLELEKFKDVVEGHFDTIQTQIDELSEMKKKVDALVLKNGFKL